MFLEKGVPQEKVGQEFQENQTVLPLPSTLAGLEDLGHWICPNPLKNVLLLHFALAGCSPNDLHF